MLQAMRKINYKLDIIIIGAIIVVSIIETVHTDMIFYNAGLVNGIGFKAVPYGLLYELLKIVIVIVAITRLSFHLKSGRRSKKYSITALASVLIFIGSWIFTFAFDQPGSVYHLRGFKKWVAKNVDVDAVQTWGMSQGAEKYFKNKPSMYFKADFPEVLPDFIRNFGPDVIIFRAGESDEAKQIVIEWSALDTSWGIVVGSPAMKTKQEGMIRHPKYQYEFRYPVMPGIFVFTEGG
jgi:hypothetical protein